MKLQRTLPLLLLLALLAGCGTSSQPSALTAEERTQLYQTAIESARDAEMNEAIGILTDTGDDMADVIFELLGVTAADMSAFALSVSPMNIKAYGIHLPRRWEVGRRTGGSQRLHRPAEAEL